MRLKYQVKKYRSLFNQEFEIEFGKVNFIIGGNESGKSNILKLIHLMGLDTRLKYTKGKDETKLALWVRFSKDKKEIIKTFKLTNTSFKIKENNKKEMQVTTGGEVIWLVNNSYYHKQLKKLFEKEKLFFAKLSLEQSGYGTLLNKTIEDVKNNFIKFANFKKFFKIPKFKKSIENKIIKIYKDAKIVQPKTFLTFPYEKALKINRLDYRVSDLKRSKSLIRAIFSSFGDPEIVEELYSETQTGEEIDRKTVEKRNMLTNNINQSIKNYFQKFKSIKAVPKLSIDSGNIFLNIDQKDTFKYEIHMDDENERSSGFKYFSRILIEVKSLIESNEYKRIIYMIDEPEQSLHPLLQKELLKELKKLIKGKNNVSIVLATHSLYSFDIGKNILFVQRLTKNEKSGFLGETIIRELSAKTWKKLSIDHNDSESIYLKSLLFDKWKTQIIKDNTITKILKTKKYQNIFDFLEMDFTMYEDELFSK